MGPLWLPLFVPICDLPSWSCLLGYQYPPQGKLLLPSRAHLWIKISTAQESLGSSSPKLESESATSAASPSVAALGLEACLYRQMQSSEKAEMNLKCLLFHCWYRVLTSLFINCNGPENNLLSVFVFFKSHPWVDIDLWKVYTNHLAQDRQAAWAVHLESQRWGAAAQAPHLGQNAPTSTVVSAPKLPAGGKALILIQWFTF